MRVLIHVQSLSGAGHFVRAFEIARALAARHDVFVVDGGWPVPRRPARVTPVPIPRIERSGGLLASLDGHARLADALASRIERLEHAARTLRPDVLLVEHFPFSKWDLEAEYRAVIAAVRGARPTAKVVASVRDVPRGTRFDDGAAWAGRPAYPERVLEALGLFDLVLVHGDPRFTRIEEHVPWAAEIPARLVYTGFVSETPPAAPGRRREIDDWLAGRGLVVASAGGGARGSDFLRTVVEAWHRLAGAVAGRALAMFLPLRASEGEIEALRRLPEASDVRVERFDPGFLDWLALADLSISRAGYNVCTNLLETRRRALLAPDPEMSDQPFRADRFERLGLAQVARDPDTEGCAASIRQALAQPPPVHDLALDGADRTRALLEAL